MIVLRFALADSPSFFCFHDLKADVILDPEYAAQYLSRVAANMYPAGKVILADKSICFENDC